MLPRGRRHLIGFPSLAPCCLGMVSGRRLGTSQTSTGSLQLWGLMKEEVLQRPVIFMGS